MSSRRGEGGRGVEEEVISCCTMCVHFPDGLSSLLPDLVCVVLHSPSYLCGFTFSVAPPASIYTYHTDLLWVCHICCFYVPFPLLLGAISSFIESPGLCAIICTFAQKLHVCLSVCLWPVCSDADSTYLSSADPLELQLLRPLWPCTEKCHRPGDGISEIMSIFTRASRPLYQERKRCRMRSLHVPSGHLSLIVLVVSWTCTFHLIVEGWPITRSKNSWQHFYF